MLVPLPVVVRAWSSGIQVIALRSYLKPLAFFSASLLEFIMPRRPADTDVCEQAIGPFVSGRGAFVPGAVLGAVTT